MEVKNEPVDNIYDEEHQPPDDAWSDLPIVKPEALETFKIPDAQNSACLLRPLLDYSPVSFYDIDIDEIDVKKEVLEHQPIEVDASFCIKSEFQTDIGRSISKEEATLRVCAVNSEDSANGAESFSFACDLKNQILVAKTSTLQNTSMDSFDDFEIDKINAKKEDLGDRPIAVVINLQKKKLHDSNFVCSICMQLFASLDSLLLHKNVHHKCLLSMNHTENESLRLQLDLRKKGLNSEYDLTSSQLCKNLYQSDDCDFKSVNRIVSRQHKLKRSDGQLSEKENFDIHKISNTSENLFECNLCDYKFARQKYLKNHQLSHTGEKPFECDQCDYKSTQKKNLTSHKLSHSIRKPFQCNFCDYKFAYNKHLKAHMLLHTGEKPFECELCDFKSAHQNSLKNHMFLHTGDKPFKCDQCDYTSVRKSNLSTHKLSHTGEKPFECDLCDYKSAHQKHLKTHKLTHTGEKPFECDLCNYKSAYKKNLNAHKLLHTGVKRFECDQCDFKSAYKKHLKTHKQSHTGAKSFE